MGSAVRLSQSKTRLKNKNLVNPNPSHKLTNVKTMSVEKCNSKRTRPIIHISIMQGLQHRSIKTKSLLFGKKQSQMSDERDAWHFMMGPPKSKKAAKAAIADGMWIIMANGDAIMVKLDGGKLLLNREQKVLFAELPDENYKILDGVVCFTTCRLIETPMSGQEAYILSRCPSMFAYQEGPKTVYRVYTLSGVNRLMESNVEYHPSINFLKSHHFNGAKTLAEVRLMVEGTDARMNDIIDAYLSSRTMGHTAAAGMRGSNQDPMASETSGSEVYVLMKPAATMDTNNNKDNADMKPASTNDSEMVGFFEQDEGDEEKKPAAKESTTAASDTTTAVNDPGNTI
jgi:hypothetical protein